MSDSTEKNLIDAFAASWSEAVAPLYGQPSSLALLSLREVAHAEVASALAVAATWPSAFVSTCAEPLGGTLICLFKIEDTQNIERAIGRPTDGQPLTGMRHMIVKVTDGVSNRLSAELARKLVFDEPGYIDLLADDGRLASIVGNVVWVGTCALTLGNDETQMLLLYAPQGSLEVLTPVTIKTADDAQATVEAKAANARDESVRTTADNANRPAGRSDAAQQTNRQNAARDEHQPRNIERLLDVELDVVVRFGVTNVPLRDVVRMGVGTMIELNRAVDEPVELLVNGRSLARGEVVVVDGYYGVRITEIGSSNERALSLM